MTNTRDLTAIKARAQAARADGDNSRDDVRTPDYALAADVLSLCALYEASQAALTDALAQLGDARALLLDAYNQLDPIYLADGVTLHPGCVSTLHELYAYLWPEGRKAGE